MTASRDALLALAERVEAATGADVQIDREIMSRARHLIRGGDDLAPWHARFTASLDCTTGLLPADHSWSVGTDGEENSGPWACVTSWAEPYLDYHGSGVTPALSLLAASLRALAEQA